MRVHALFWNWVMMFIGLLGGLLFLLVGIFDITHAEQVASQIGSTVQDVINACIVFICVGSLLMIISITVASLSAHYIKTAKKKDTLIVTGILSIIFNFIVPGILILSIKEKELEEPYTPYVYTKKK